MLSTHHLVLVWAIPSLNWNISTKKYNTPFWDISTFLYFKDIQFRHILKCTGTWFNATCQYSPIHESATSQWIKCTYLLFVQVIKYLERALALLLLFNLGNDSSESDGSTHPWQTGSCIQHASWKALSCEHSVCVCVCVCVGGWGDNLRSLGKGQKKWALDMATSGCGPMKEHQ